LTRIESSAFLSSSRTWEQMSPADAGTRPTWALGLGDVRESPTDLTNQSGGVTRSQIVRPIMGIWCPSVDHNFLYIWASAKVSSMNRRDSSGSNCEGWANEIDESDLQNEKHEEPRIWTVEGIIIDWSDENENATDSIRVNCELDSKEIEESDSQDEKHFEPRIWTLLGIKIDWSNDL
jgi:hypothetical protein